MTEHSPSEPTPLKAHRPLAVVRETVMLSVPAAGIAWFLGAMLNREGTAAGWALSTITAVTVVFAVYWSLIRNRRFWSQPTDTLVEAIRAVRKGQLPIDELSTIDGGIAPLVPLVQELLRELKQQKGEVAQLDLEMRQRVAVRTDALQRKIGSLQVQATRDALTGLFNRRVLELELPRVIAEYKAGGAGACLLMIDVDNFKILNDTLGHAAGDQLLKEIGQIIRSTIREEDLAFRYGGDEFVVLLNNCSLVTGQSMGERLESLVQALTKPLRLEKRPRLSIGACALSELDDPTAESHLEVADKRLYALKTARKQPGPGPIKRAG